MGGQRLARVGMTLLVSLIAGAGVARGASFDCKRATAPIERAISSAGGIALGEFDENLMLRKLPGIFAAGEMLDWEAPTGGYLLQATFSTAVAAARGMLGMSSGKIWPAISSSSNGAPTIQPSFPKNSRSANPPG